VDFTVKLITTAEHEVQGPYLTLSHCWGGAPPALMLTADSAAALEGGVDIASLEHTYRDALLATQSLGIKYLWIDLFCIFQGQDPASIQGWATESLTTDQVYAEGLLDISAAHGLDGNTGCFTQISNLATSPSIVVPWAMSEGAELKYYELAEESALHGEADLLNAFYRTSNVFKRGWIVQERLLAPRVLHFASQTLVWECCGGVATQRRPHVSQRYDVKLLRPLPGYLGPRAESWPRSELIGIWCNAIWTYSRAKLTKPDEDKLIAAQGISKCIAGLLHDSLCFGFLSCTLPHALCWSNRPEPLVGRVGTVNRAFSSWHFARSNEEFLFSEQHILQHLDRRDTHTTLLRIIPIPDLNPTLPSLPKHLCCVASTLALTITPSPDCPSESRILSRLQLTHLTTSPAKNRSTLSSTLEPYGDFKITLDVPTQESSLSGHPWTLLPVYITAPVQTRADRARSLRIFHQKFTVTMEDFYFAKCMCCVGLFLQQNGDGTFVRKGMFNCYWIRLGGGLEVLLEALGRAKPRLVMIS